MRKDISLVCRKPLRILSIGPDGSVTELFPNKFDRQNYIEANRVYRIPGDRPFFIKVQGPAFGTEVIKVVASSAQFPGVTADAWSQTGTFRSLGNYRGVLRNLGVEPGGKILAEDHFTITTVQRAASP